MAVTPKKTLLEITPYPKGKPNEKIMKENHLNRLIDLSTNESFVGISDSVNAAILNTLPSTRLYPDGSLTYIREQLALYYCCSPEMITLGTGSDNLIELISHAYLSPGDETIMAEVTFPLYYTNALVAMSSPVLVPLKDYCYDLDGILNAITSKTKVIWLCNPNNPTGTIYSETAQRRFLSQVPSNILVVIDEAYYEYANSSEYPSSIPLLREYDNVIITRTFSKLYALASLRIGYAISSPEIISYLERIRSPYNISAYAQNAAVATLQDISFYENVKQQTFDNIKYLYDEFDKMGLSYIPTHTNFIMVDIKRDSKRAAVELLKHGILVKAAYGFGMPTFLRITVGSIEDCRLLIEKLTLILKEIN